MHRIHITLFTKLDIRRSGQEIPKLPAKAEELLCYLLLHRDRPHTREALACELWADAPAARSRKYLRQCLWQLQQVLEQPQADQPPLLRLEQEWVGLHPDAAVQVDAVQFEQAFTAIRNVPGATLDPSKAEAAQQAVALYQGTLLSGWYQTWCLAERERYELMFFAMLEKLMDYCAAHQLFDQGIAYGMQLLRIDPTHERTHRQLMRLYYLAGDRSMALRQFEQCATALEREFGVQPTEQTLALREQIRTGGTAEQGRAEQGKLAPHALSDPEPKLLAALLAELTYLRGSVTRLQHDLDQIKQVLHA